MNSSAEDDCAVRAIPHVSLRSCQARDGARMFEFVRMHGGLELNSAYAYLLLCERFGDCSLLADANDETAGFVLGIRTPASAETLFVWQIGVAPLFRKRGLGARMLDVLLERRQPRYLEAHVAADNRASEALFRALARRHRAPFAMGDGLPSAWFPDAHQEERLVRVGPFSW
jgi:L-2,4-diaminobutyric acid acetyltransferase